MNNKTTFSFPSLTDDDGDDASMVSLNLGTASTFITANYPNLNINPTTSSNIGNYSVTVTVTDDNSSPKSAKYTLKINVLPDSTSSSSSSLGSNVGSSASFSASLFKPKITDKVNNDLTA